VGRDLRHAHVYAYSRTINQTPTNAIVKKHKQEDTTK
jgi:hypothetical protein